jgi:serine/threonine kinase 32
MLRDDQPPRAAPEVLGKRGYHGTIDWWSLGVIAYELLVGKRPWRGKTNSNLTHAILRDPLRWPDPMPANISDAAMSCIRGLLERDITKRLGCKGAGGVEALKAHPWFRGLDWEALARKELKPPFEPDVRVPLRTASRSDLSSPPIVQKGQL